MTAPKAATVFRDYETDGVPDSGAHQVKKVDARQWGANLEAIIASGVLSDAVWKSTKALLTADLAHDADTLGVVYDDATVANDGLYIKSGASGSGSWSQLTTFLPGYQFVTASDDGSSTANALTMDTSPQLPAGDGVALVALPIPATNTSATVTVAFDGGDALTIKMSSGNAPAVGGLVEGMMVVGLVTGDGTVFRLLSDQASAAIQAAAEAAQAAAETAQAAAEDARDDAQAAQAAAEAAAAGVNLPPIGAGDAGKALTVKSDESGFDLSALPAPTFGTKALAEAYAPASAPDFLRTAGYAAAGDRGGALYKKVASEPSHTGKFSITLSDGSTVVWYEIAEPIVDARMLGVFPVADADDAVDCAAGLNELFSFAAWKSIRVPEGVYGLASTLTLGNGTSTTRSTINSVTIIFEGQAAISTAMVNKFSGLPRTGAIFKWIGAANGTVMEIAGPIHGIRGIGALQILGENVADYGLRVFSMGTSIFDCLNVYACVEKNIDFYVREVDAVTGIEGDGNGIGTASNIFDQVFSFSPNNAGATCVSFDGYKVASGPDCTHNIIHHLKYGLPGDGGTGLQLGYCDFNRIDQIVGITYGTVQNNAAGVRLVGTTTPFHAPDLNFIGQAAVGQNVGVVATGGVGDNYIFNYSINDASIAPFGVPGISGYVRSAANDDIDGLPFGFKNELRARADVTGQGVVLRASGGTFIGGLTRNGNQVRLSAFGSPELEKGATGGPGTGTLVMDFLGTSSAPRLPTAYAHTSASSANLGVDADGTLFRSTSSRRYKTAIRDLSLSVADIAALRPVRYRSRSEHDPDREFAGLISEEVNAAGLARFVEFGEGGREEGIFYGQLGAVAAVVLAKEVVALQERIAQLERGQ